MKHWYVDPPLDMMTVDALRRDFHACTADLVGFVLGLSWWTVMLQPRKWSILIAIARRVWLTARELQRRELTAVNLGGPADPERQWPRAAPAEPEKT